MLTFFMCVCYTPQRTATKPAAPKPFLLLPAKTCARGASATKQETGTFFSILLHQFQAEVSRPSMQEPPSDPDPSKPCLKKSARMSFWRRSGPPYLEIICEVVGSWASLGSTVMQSTCARTHSPVTTDTPALAPRQRAEARPQHARILAATGSGSLDVCTPVCNGRSTGNSRWA